jgi:hypothetical protein
MKKKLLFLILFSLTFLFSVKSWAQYTVNFEGTGETKASYASGTVKLSGLDWNMTDVLIGESTADWKIGNRSARLRGYTTTAMTMLENKANGIGSITFQYRKYGTDPQVEYKVEYSTDDGVIWTQIGNAFTAPASDVVQTFTEAVNIIGNIRVRIKTTGTGTLNKRLNIDDIIITDFTGGSQTVATPSFSQAPGICENPFDLSISCITPDANIYYTLDGTDPDETSNHYTIPFNVSQTTTVKARAYATGFDPSNIATGIYTFRTIVSTIAELRAGTAGTPYLLTGEVFVTYFQSTRNQKFVQDYTAAMLIDDVAGVIPFDYYEIGDGITGLKGSFTIFTNGMLEFIPAYNPGDPSGFHLFTPEVITIADLNTNFENYESELVKIENATFTQGGTLFNATTSTVYEITDVSDAIGGFRTTFLGADYLGTTIPVGPTTIIGICNSAGTTPIGSYITSRFSADIIPASVTPTIILTSPDGGEFWQRSTTETIKWNNLNFTGNVNIDLKTAFGYTNLASNVGNTGTWNWAIPANQAIGSNYKIRVKNASAATPVDESSSTFTITDYIGLPRIVINEIMYNSIEGGDNEWIELYNREAIPIDLEDFVIKDNLDTHIISIPAGYSILPNGYFTVAVTTGTSPLFFTPDYNAAAGWGLNNDTDQVRLYAPDGTVIDSVQYSDSSPWPTGADGSGPSLELIDPSLDNTIGQNWLASAATNGTPGAQNSMFNFQSLTVTSPNGGESLEQGSTHLITWTSVNFTGTIKIELETIADGLVTLAENVPVADGSWNWVIPADQAVGSNYKIQISDQVDGNPMDQSNAVFSIIAVIPPSLAVTSPNGGELWEQGTTHAITWTSVNFAGNIKIELETVAKGLITLAENVPVTDLTYSWVIPAGQTPGTNYKIKISDQVDGDPMDQSDAAFSVIEVIPPSITVTVPNGGEQWEQGSTHAITWTSVNFAGNVKIELSDGAKILTVLNSSIAASAGTWPWLIPADQALASTYTIIISGLVAGEPSDASNSPFSIIAPLPLPNLVINEIMYNSSSLDNEWIEIYNNGTTTVNLEGYYIQDNNDLSTKVTFPAGYSIAPGQYFTVSLELLAPPLPFVPDFVGNPQPSWSLGNTSDQVRIFTPGGFLVDLVGYFDTAPWPTAPDGSGPSLSLLDPNLDNNVGASWAASLINGGSPGAENFPPTPTLTVTSPNGGEQWIQGSTYPITWISANFTGNIKIELETAANTFVTLAENIPAANGTWSWAIPADQAVGSNYKIKISDQADGDPMDTSNATFSVIAPPSLPKIVITEIMYNPAEIGTDSTEFFEIYNNDVMNVNLLGWTISKGVVFTFPSYDLAPGAYCVIAFNSAKVLSDFGIPSLQYTSGALSNSGEALEIKNANAEVIDYVLYDEVAPWPTAANGNGPSLSLCDPSSDNSVAANWSPCIEFVKLNAAGVGIYATPGAGCSGALAQTMIIPTGWSGVSSYMIPTTPAVSSMFAPIVNSVVVLQDFSKLYLPSLGINTIGNWDIETGYQIKLTASKYFVIKGTYETDKTISLTAGWNGIPVISTCPVNVAALFGSIPEIVFAKEMGSDLVYWPGGELYTLTTLVPGRAYFVKTSIATTLTFPECAGKGDVVFDEPVNNIQSIWNEVTPTGASHAIGFAASALANLKAGDVIGAFNATGVCSGITQVGEGNALIMAWADDIYTSEVDGFNAEEQLTYKVYRPSTGEVFEVSAVYDSNSPDAGTFVTHGISFVTELKMGATGINALTAGNVRIYPNPATSAVNIEMVQQFTSVEVYSMVGSLLYAGNVSGNLLKLDVSNFDRGVYFLKLINQNSGDQVTTRFIKD